VTVAILFVMSATAVRRGSGRRYRSNIEHRSGWNFEVNVAFYFVKPHSMASEKRVLVFDLSKIIANDFVVVLTHSRKPSPPVSVVLTNRDDDALAHLARLTPLCCKFVSAAKAIIVEIPRAEATASGVTRVLFNERMACRYA
jgi:hypothetical protein